MSYIAIDIGASSGRHIAFDLIDNKLVSKEIYRFPNGVIRNHDGSLIWDHVRLFEEIKAGLREARKQNIKVDYVAIDTWAVDYALLDENDEVIGDVYCYRDERGKIAASKLHQNIPFKDIYLRNGIQYAPLNTIYQLYDDVLTGRIKQAKTMLMLPDYFNFLLTGIKKQEYTNATTTALIHKDSHDWDYELIDNLNIPRTLFVPISQPGTVVGHFKKDIIKEIGYDAVVLLPATHDTASAIIAAPINFGEPYISSGTWSLLGVEEKHCHTEDEALECNYSNEGDVNYTYRFQKNIVGLWMIQQVRHELNDQYSFAELADLARANPTKKIIDVTDECFLAPKNMINEIKKKIGDVSIGEMAYSIYHSLAICYRDSLKQLEILTNRYYTSLNIVGGGANNSLLNELTAEACKVKIIAGPSEATAIGNVIMQLIATDKIKNVEEGRELVKRSFPIDEII